MLQLLRVHGYTRTIIIHLPHEATVDQLITGTTFRFQSESSSESLFGTRTSFTFRAEAQPSQSSAPNNNSN